MRWRRRGPILALGWRTAMCSCPRPQSSGRRLLVSGRGYPGAGRSRPEGPRKGPQTPGYRRVHNSTKPAGQIGTGHPESLRCRPDQAVAIQAAVVLEVGISLHGEGVTLPSHPSMIVRVYAPISVSLLCIQVRIPVSLGHWFRRDLDTCSGGTWTLVPAALGHWFRRLGHLFRRLGQ